MSIVVDTYIIYVPEKNQNERQCSLWSVSLQVGCGFLLFLCFCRRARFPAICNIWGPQTCHFACYLHHFGDICTMWGLQPIILHAICTLLDLGLPFCMLFAHFWNLNLSVCMLLATFWDLNGLFRVCLGLTSGWFRIYLGFV